MTYTPAGPEREYVIRDTSLLVVFWLGVVALAALVVLLGTPLFGSDWSLFGFLLPPALLLAWTLWLVLYHPQVRYNPTRALVINIGRVHELPWARVSAVRQRLTLVFDLTNGRTVTAAGVSAPRGAGTVVGGISGRLGEAATHFNRNAEALDAQRASAAPTDAQAVSRWDVVPLVIGAVLLVASTIDLLVAVSIP